MSMIPGQKLTLRGEEFTIAPLTLDALEALLPTDEAGNARPDAPLSVIGSLRLDRMPNREQMEAIVTVVEAAMKPNHPSITREQVRKVVDLGNLGEVIAAVLGQSGFKRAAPSGEAPAA